MQAALRGVDKMHSTYAAFAVVLKDGTVATGVTRTPVETLLMCRRR